MNKNKIFTYILIFFILAISIVFCFCLRKKNENKLTKKIKISEPTRSVFYAPQYVALELGFLEEEGIKAEIITANGSNKVMTAVLSGQSDIGLSGLETVIFVAKENKNDFPLLFAKLTKKDGSFLIGREKSEWKDLKGKSIIAGRIGSMPEMCLEYVLRQKCILQNVKLLNNIQFDLMPAAFLQGIGDYITLFEPLASEFEQKGFYIISSIGKELEEIPYTCYCASRNYIKNNFDLIEKFVKSVYRSQIWVKNHSSEEISNAIKKYFPDTNSELLAKTIENYKKLDVWSENPAINKFEYDTAQKIVLQAGQIDEETEFEKIYINDFAAKYS
ncbi:MAG: ABC transporter substrate-binding protein [Oscillospiraceae bacterium]|nr:ABC transporter substrate-binding protein [Oscillospiraceae bacterium]